MEHKYKMSLFDTIEKMKPSSQIDDNISQTSTQASSSRQKIADDMANSFAKLQQSQSNKTAKTGVSKQKITELKNNMRQILHRMVSLTSQNPEYFQQHGVDDDNTAIAKLAEWASKHTH